MTLNVSLKDMMTMALGDPDITEVRLPKWKREIYKKQGRHDLFMKLVRTRPDTGEYRWMADMTDEIAVIGEKWEPYGLSALFEDANGAIVLDDDGRLGPYWFGVAGDLECLFGRPLHFVDMPGHGELIRLWEAKNGK